MSLWHGLIFKHGGGRSAIAADKVGRIAHAPQLAAAPGTPAFIAGLFVFAGEPVPVIRLDRLLGLEERPFGFYAPLIILKTEPKIALHVEAVERLIKLRADELVPLPPAQSFNGCAQAQFEADYSRVTVLCVERLLLRQEQEAVTAHLAREMARLSALSTDAVHGH